jgi:N-acetylmuramoyl-L-alanine amidase
MAGHYITRTQWGARPAKAWTPMPRPVGTVFIHHSVTPFGADGMIVVPQIQRTHMDTNGWNDIAYQELVHDNGDVYEGRGFGVIGGATRGENSTSLSICALGNYEHVIPSAALITSIVNRIVAAVQEGRLHRTPQIKGHMDSSATACPGRFLYERIPEITARVIASVSPPPAPDLPPTEDDMYYLYTLHPKSLNAGEPRDWVVTPGGEKFACGSTHYLERLKAVGARQVDLSADLDASSVFRNAHP